MQTAITNTTNRKRGMLYTAAIFIIQIASTLDVSADQSISLQGGANIEGRLIARIGAVTMQSNTIVVPAN